MIGSRSFGPIKIEVHFPSEAFCDLRGCCYFDDLPSHTLFQTKGTGNSETTQTKSFFEPKQALTQHHRRSPREGGFSTCKTLLFAHVCILFVLVYIIVLHKYAYCLHKHAHIVCAKADEDRNECCVYQHWM